MYNVEPFRSFELPSAGNKLSSIFLGSTLVGIYKVRSMLPEYFAICLKGFVVVFRALFKIRKAGIVESF